MAEKSGTVSFNKEFTSRITESGESRGDALRSSSLVDVFQNRSDISENVKNARVKLIQELGFENITLGDISKGSPAREQFIKSIINKGSSAPTKALIGDFKKILAEVGVTAQGTTNPFRTMIREAVGEAAYNAAGFATDTDRLIPVMYPRQVYSESKRVVAGLMEDPKTRPAGGRMLLMMMGGYRPSDFKALRIENIDFETGLVKGLELKTDDKKTVKIGYLPEPQRDIVRSIIGGKTSGLVFDNPASLDKTINTALTNSNIPEIEYLQESSGNYVKQKFTSYDFRRVNETNLSSKGYNDNDIVRKVLTWRPPAGNVQKYQAVIDQSGAIEEANARAFEPYVLLSEGNIVDSPDGTRTKTHGQFLTDVGVAEVSPYTQRYVVTSDAVSKLPVYLQDAVAEESTGITFSDKPISNVKIDVDPAASTTFKELSKVRLETDLAEAKIKKAEAAQRLADMPEATTTAKPAETTVAASADEAFPGMREKAAAKGIDLDKLLNGMATIIDKTPKPIKSIIPGVAIASGYATGKAKAAEMGASPAVQKLVGGAYGVSEVSPGLSLSDVQDMAAGRQDPDPFGVTPASRIAAEEQMNPGSTGFVEQGIPEAAPATDQGFLSR